MSAAERGASGVRPPLAGEVVVRLREAVAISTTMVKAVMPTTIMVRRWLRSCEAPRKTCSCPPRVWAAFMMATPAGNWPE